MTNNNQPKEFFLNKCIDKAKLYKGLCLSKKFINTRTKLIWKCNNDKHAVFEAFYTNVVNGMAWCSECPPFINNKLDLAKYLANSKGGECLEENYLGAMIKHKWKCNNNHVFEANFNDVVSKGRWCVYCANQVTCKTKILKIQDSANQHIDRLEIAKVFAISKNGYCISTQYKNSSSKLLWKCSNPKHEPFQSRYNSVINQNSWCPKCAEFHINEARVRNILKNILDIDLKKDYPEWNVNSKTGKILELDGYSESSKIAFEYQGIQHYYPVFNKNIEELLEQQERDKIKAENCKNNGVKLILVLANRHYDNYKSTMNAIIKGINDVGITLQSNPILDPKNEEIYNKTTNHINEEKLKECKYYAQLKNGFCLNNEYLSAREKMLWKCENPVHATFLRSYEGIVKNKTWCPKCKNKQP